MTKKKSASEKPTTNEKNAAAVLLGRMGGQKLVADRGPDYFRKLQARRKVRRGGKPKARTT